MALKAFDVVVNGMINLDVNVANVHCGFLAKKLTNLDQISLSLGGDAQNCALTLARSGYRTAICGRIGNDQAGMICKQGLESSGVDSSFLSISENGTGIAINLVQSGESSVLFREGANREFCLDDIDVSLFTPLTIVSLNSFFCCGLINEEFFIAAKKRGAITVADTNTVLSGNHIAQIANCFPYIDYFIPSYAEAKALTGETYPKEIADIFLDYGVSTVVVKLGEEGCFVKNRKISKKIPGFQVEVVDTTGAGDNFVAGFIMGLCDGLDVEECATLGNAAGAITVQSLGSNGAVKSLKQLKDFIMTKKLG